MLQTASRLKGYSIDASDGQIGHVVDFFIEDTSWVVRFVVVETGSWISRERVLISPALIGAPDHHAKALPVTITREQVRHSPDVDAHMPVNRQHETDLSGYYGFPTYWDDGEYWGSGMYANPAFSGYELHTLGLLNYEDTAIPETASIRNADPHLRSNNELENYQIHASDGTIGHVSDLVFEEHTWAVRYLVVKIGHWWQSESVLIPPTWIESIDWGQSEVWIKYTRDAVRQLPEFNPGKPFDATIEKSQLDYHNDNG